MVPVADFFQIYLINAWIWFDMKVSSAAAAVFLVQLLNIIS
jgi:hypothetical protein